MALTPSYRLHATFSTKAVALCLVICLVLCLTLFKSISLAQDMKTLERKGVRVYFGDGNEPLAHEVSELFPHLRQDLESIFGWEWTGIPSVVLIQDSSHFLEVARNPLIVAFADPQKGVAVLDCTRLIKNRMSLSAVLKHELFHLYIHQHIRDVPIPRWLEEGVAQWVSDGVAEIIQPQRGSLLKRAAFQGRFIPLRYLEKGFPPGKQELILAYEQSRSITDYMIEQAGRRGLVLLLHTMASGIPVEEAIPRVFSSSLPSLEKTWQQSLARKTNWLVYVSIYLYEILFAGMAVLSILGFIRIIRKKRAYLREASFQDENNEVFLSRERR